VAALDAASRAAWAGYSALSRIELFGFPSLKPDDEERLADLLACFEEVPIDTRVIDDAIAIRRRRKIRVPDAIIAASTRVMSSTLVTRNSDDFAGIPRLVVSNPFSSC
jgi:predicted nucleic acid-binding protein